MKKILPFHPFPARMAPEIAFGTINELEPGSIVLDPMAGSGTSLLIAAEHKCKAWGRDVEPLALLITKTWNTNLNPTATLEAAQLLIDKAKRLTNYHLPWIDNETQTYIDFWFAQRQRESLSRIALCISKIKEEQLKSVCQVALSRCIITKEKGASLARDVSHAKPHKVRSDNDFDVYSEFLRAVKFIVSRLQKYADKSRIEVELGDARQLNIQDESIDCVITSPPYLHAVDYFRGHRLSLVWMGYTLSQLRQLKEQSIGLQKLPEECSHASLINDLLLDVCKLDMLPSKKQKHLQRYALDIYRMCGEWFRVLRGNRKATTVIADSFSSGIAISSTQLIKNAARMHGFQLLSDTKRSIPANKRYLPPPEYLTQSSLDNRMKTESILTFLKP